MSDQNWPSTPGNGDDVSGGSQPPPPGSTPPPPPPPGPTSQPGAGTAPGLAMRFLGRILDGLIVGIPIAIVLAIIPGVSASGVVFNLLASLLGFGYFVYLESEQGGTLGKKVLNMRVTDASGGNLTMEASARRNWWVLIGVLGGVPVISLLAGLASLAVAIYIAVTISSAPDNRGWHDKLAAASVVPA